MQIYTAIYRLAISLWAGGAALFTFVLTPIIFSRFARDQAGAIVGHLFPAYFRWGLACGTAALLIRILLRGKEGMPVTLLLAGMLCLTSFQAFYIEPAAAALKREITSFETTPKDHPARRSFAKLHGVSAACNLAVIAGGVILVIIP